MIVFHVTGIGQADKATDLRFNPGSQSLEELMIAVSSGASVLIRSFHSTHPQTDISRTRYITNAILLYLLLVTSTDSLTIRD